MIEIAEKTRRRSAVIICTILFIGLQVLVIRMEMIGKSNFNGVIMTVQFALCLLMIRVAKRRGIVLAVVLMSISILFVLRAIIFGRQLGPLPGLTNTIIYIIVLLFINAQYREREKAAVTDFLTGLMNRRGLVQLFNEKKEANKVFHFIYVELANFRIVNDNNSHKYGDRLLKDIANTIKDCVGSLGEVVRLDGNEFVIVLDDKNDVKEVASEVLKAIREKASITLYGARIENVTTPYAGIASYPQDATDMDELLKFADIAMSRAKREHAKEPFTYIGEMKRTFAREVELEKFMKLALEKDYFYMVYQPQYRSTDHSLRGFEALLRLRTPEGEVVAPSEFIPVAEENGMILDIDYYVLERVMRDFNDTIKDAKSDATLSINISAQNICSRGFAERVKLLMEKYDYPSVQIEIEITEYCLADAIEITTENINLLREMGVRIALDDFGTGYTSLSYLTKLQFDLLKIDKSLIDDIATNEKARGFVQAVIALGHMMGCEVLAEGVEELDQLEIIKNQDCDFVQGFVWSRPVEVDSAREMVV